MASPPPNYSQESTYPQPAVPVEMKVFQGGGMDQSLYDQPMKPVPLTEFRGGGNGDGDVKKVELKDIEKFRGLSIQEIGDVDKDLLDMMFIIHIYGKKEEISNNEE